VAPDGDMEAPAALFVLGFRPSSWQLRISHVDPTKGDLPQVPYLVGGLEHFLFFPYIGNVIIPTDKLRFFRGVGQPPTSNYVCCQNSVRIFERNVGWECQDVRMLEP